MAKQINNYTIIKELGRGTYGVVSKVEKGGKYYAMKEIKIDEEEYLTGLKELDIMSRVNHENIIKHIDFFFDVSISKKGSKAMYYILPLADSDLSEYIKNNKLTIDQQIVLVYEILSGLKYLHDIKVFHCDIKPDNILMFGDKPVIADLGLSFYFTGPVKLYCQSYDYASPEALVNIYKIPLTSPIKGLKSGYNYKTIETWAIGVLIGFISSRQNIFFASGKTLGDMIKKIFYYVSVFESDPVNYLKMVGVDSEWINLLLNLLNIDYDLRIKTIDEILNYDIFKNKYLNNPVMGTYIQNIPIYINCVNDKDVYRTKFDYIRKFSERYDLRLITFVTSIYLFYRIHDKLNLAKSPLGDIIYSMICIFISINLHEPYSTNIDPDVYIKVITKQGIKITKEEFLNEEIRVVKELGGILNISELYTLSFSLNSLIKGITLLYDCNEFSKISGDINGIKNFMTYLEVYETFKEKQDRKDKNIKVSDIKNVKLY